LVGLGVDVAVSLGYRAAAFDFSPHDSTTTLSTPSVEDEKKERVCFTQSNRRSTVITRFFHVLVHLL